MFSKIGVFLIFFTAVSRHEDYDSENMLVAAVGKLNRETRGQGGQGVVPFLSPIPSMLPQHEGQLLGPPPTPLNPASRNHLGYLINL